MYVQVVATGGVDLEAAACHVVQGVFPLFAGRALDHEVVLFLLGRGGGQGRGHAAAGGGGHDSSVGGWVGGMGG